MRGKKKRKLCTNYKDIIFTYTMAAKYGITIPRFTRGMDCLIEKGFIDIVNRGGNLSHDKTIYGLSDRWEKYGKKDEFNEVKREKRMINLGMCEPKKVKNTHTKP